MIHNCHKKNISLRENTKFISSSSLNAVNAHNLVTFFQQETSTSYFINAIYALWSNYHHFQYAIWIILCRCTKFTQVNITTRSTKSSREQRNRCSEWRIRFATSCKEVVQATRLETRIKKFTHNCKYVQL